MIKNRVTFNAGSSYKFILWSLLYVFLNTALASSDNIRFERVDMEYGLSQQTIMSIYQDSRGFMWFGTQEGLNKFDGVDFTTYSPSFNEPNSISSPWINAITEDSYGNLWVGTQNGLSVLNTKSNQFTRYMAYANEKSINGKNVRDVVRANNDVMWVATNRGLNKYIPAEDSFNQFNYSSPDGSDVDIYVILEDFAGFLWLGTNEHGLLRFDPNTGKTQVIAADLNKSEEIKATSIRSLYIDDTQTLWIGTNGRGLYKIDLTQSKPANIEDSIVAIEFNTKIALHSIQQDHQKTLWIGSESGLYYKKDGEDTFNFLTKSESSTISNDQVWSLYPDRSGVFWVGTFNGLNKWNTNTTQFDHFYADPSKENTISSNSITLFEKYQNSIYIGHTKGLDVLDLDTGKVSSVSFKDDNNVVGLNRVMTMLTVSIDEVWFGHRNAGATRYNPITQEYRHYPYDADNPRSIGQTGITSILKAGDDTLWFGTFGGGLSRYDRDTDDFTSYRHDANDISTLSSDRIMTIHQANNGNLWVGTWDGGINIFVPRTGAAFRMQKRQDDPTSLGANMILTIHEDEKENLWVGTQGGGLNILTKDSLDKGRFEFEKLHIGNGMPSNVVYGILADEDGYIWASTNKGIVKINPDSLEVTKYNVDHGLQGNEFHSGAYLRDGNYLYFGGTNGVTRFKAADIKPNEIPPQIELTNFQRLNKVVTISEAMTANNVIETFYTDYLIGFEFAALDFASPSNNQYKYKLDGFDKDWVEVRDVRRATYTNLPSGEYTFKVIASNSDGVWNNQGSSITLLVHPAPWFSLWAYAIYSLITLGILWLIVSHFKRKAKLNLDYQIKLEQEVTERTIELSEANEQLLHASITDQLTGLHNRRYLSDAIIERLDDITKRFSEALIEDTIDSRSGPRLMALMFDLDGFKPINDNYGHEAGDKVIVQVAEILTAECSEDDIVIRWGGDEYMVVAEVNDVSEAEALAEKIRQAIANHGFDVGLSNRFHLSSSLGFALYPFCHYAPHSISWDQVHLLADQALYKSKDAGRNTWTGIVQADEELPFSILNSLIPNLDTAIEKSNVIIVQREKGDKA